MVNGYVTFMGKRIEYRNGMFALGNRQLRVSKDRDFVIDAENAPVGAIINNALIPVTELPASSLAFFRAKYGF